MMLKVLSRSMLVVILLLSLPIESHSQENATPANTWTVESAKEELRLRPGDPYVQVVISQLARDEEATVGPLFRQPQQTWRSTAEPASRVDLFSIFSGSLAVQESLQLDALTNVGAENAETQTFKIGSLAGPSVSSHPWHKLLAGRTPEVSQLANCVPANQLFVRFQSVGKLWEMRQLAEDYRTYVSIQAHQSNLGLQPMERIRRQLALSYEPALRTAYDAAIAEVAMTCSDLYFNLGTDVTLLLRLESGDTFQPVLDAMLQQAAQSDPQSQVGSGEALGIPYRSVTTRDRSLQVFAANPRPDLHVRANSLVALKRVLSTMLEPRHNTPLGETEEFRYIRTLMPLGSEQEDGLVYMSDPFIREIVGPTKKLTQRARLLCNSRLQMMAYASLLYQTQYGKLPTSLEELQSRNCWGTAEKPLNLTCPAGGKYTLHEDGIRGTCSHHGCLHGLLPCNEIPRTAISEIEARQYEQFVQNYERYWTTFFDPIVFRIQHSEKQIRLETIVLPLINNSIYRGLAGTLGGHREELDQLPIASSNIFSVAARLNKNGLLDRLGIEPPAEITQETPAAAPSAEVIELDSAVGNLQMLGLAVRNFESAYKRLPPISRSGRSDEPADQVGLSWRVQLLPFLGEINLYHQFRLDEPWDSEHNRQFIERMPAVFAGSNQRLSAQGKTRFVRPYHSEALHFSHTAGAKIGATGLAGLSNTILAVVADEERSVIWTKPEDLDIAWENPSTGWDTGFANVVPLAMADGRIVSLPRSTSDEQVRALLSRSSSGLVRLDLPPLAVQPVARPSLLSRIPGSEELQLAEFLYQGLGNQIALHICDSDPPVDFSVSRFLGMMGGSFNGRSPMMMGQVGMMAALAMSMNAPVYVSAPIQDAELTDRFLARLDDFLVRLSHDASSSSTMFWGVKQETYRFSGPQTGQTPVRAYGFSFGPVTWRFYWTRIDNGLYVASKPAIVTQLRQAHAAKSDSPAVEPYASSHGMVRVRPGNWKQVKSHFAMGWAESERRACLNNLGPLTDVMRALAGDDAQNIQWPQVEARLRETLGKQAYCPCGGIYAFHSQDKTAFCSVHGSLAAPRQPVSMASSSLMGLAATLRDVQLQLNFLEDGLHAVVNIVRH